MKNISAVEWLTAALRALLSHLFSRYPTPCMAAAAIACSMVLSHLNPGPWFGN